MIPLTLELKNFLSYGEKESIDFKDYPLICLSGRNGHGKSALLDAITWSIWGQARKTSGKSKADDGLLRLGQTHMMVSMKFEFNKTLYRVRREFYKTFGKNKSALDFEIFKDGRFISLTDKTIRATQEKIERLLGLDFETFVNSAFLRQGHSNEFSRKTPKERKEILGSILSLSKFDLLKQKAQEHARKFQDEKKIIVALEEQAKQELEGESEINSKIVENKKLLDLTDKKLLENQAKIDELEKEKIKISSQKQVVDNIKKDIDSTSKQYELTLKEFLANFNKWRDIHTKNLSLPDLATLEKQKKELNTADDTFRKKQQEILIFQEKSLELKELYQSKLGSLEKIIEKDLSAKRSELEKELANQKNITFVLEHSEKSKLDIKYKIKKTEDELAAIDKRDKLRGNFKEKFEKDSARFDKRKAFYQKLISRGNWIKSALSDIEHKKSVAMQDSPSCFLCEQVLTARRKQFLAQKLVKEQDFLNYRLIRVSKLIKKLKDILIDDHKYIQSLTSDYDNLKADANKRVDLNKILEDTKGQLKDLEKAILDGSYKHKVVDKKIAEIKLSLEKEKENLEATISQNKELSEIKKQLLKIDERKKELKYDKVVHQNVISAINKVSDQISKLDSSSKEEQLSRYASVKTLKASLKDQKIRLKDLKLKLKGCELASQEDFNKKYHECSLAKKMLLDEKNNLVRKIGSLEGDLKRIDQVRRASTERSKRLGQLDAQIYDYNSLASIFGRDGIQALLIEEAIPDIEDEANAILSRLTDNNSQIMIESLRDLKKGGMKETLDIKVSDAFGIRPYEMFSGGEAFRIDFALRIAISKLLARRAGTALQTLIIDEGFGSQDEEGLARLMDAIHVIRRNFARIIVVSHLPAFRSNFPVHFHVNKLSSGSKVSVTLKG